MNPPERSPVEIAVAYCFDCHEVIGPNDSAGVGEEMAFDHRRCNAWLIDEWDEEVDGSAVNREAGAVVDLVCEMMEDLTDEQVARLLTTVRGTAYERKITEEYMGELLDG